jgi:hypothetical protein
VKPQEPIYLATRGRIDPTVRNVKPQVPIYLATCGCVGEEVSRATILSAYIIEDKHMDSYHQRSLEDKSPYFFLSL